MVSDIYKACRDGDIHLLQALMETSPDNADINQLESNGSTALHIACSQGHTYIVQLLLNDLRVDRLRTDEDGQTAYDVASTDEIRQLFHRPKQSENPFCTDQNTASPFVVITNENSSESRYIHTYPIDSPILEECYLEVLDDNHNALHLIVDWFKSLFGNDPHQKKIDKWVQYLQLHMQKYFIDECLERNCEPNYQLYTNACRCIKQCAKTRNIEHLLTLYTLDVSICRWAGLNSDSTNCLCAPILFNLFNVKQRAYQGSSFRGLIMEESEFRKYEHAYHHKGSYIKTKTFCSTSIDPSVAEMFTGTETSEGTINVIMNFEFLKPCSTALVLFSSSPELKCISKYPDEKEVLILPATIFSVKFIEENNAHIKIIHLEYFDTDEVKGEMHRERLQNYIEAFVLD